MYHVTIAEAINKAAAQLSGRGVPNARLDAELLLRHALGKDRAWLLAHIQDSLDDISGRLFEGFVNRRATREPAQHIIGVQEFWGLEFVVTRVALIPRPETELVVESALKEARGIASPVIIDLCTGSGCIAISLAKEIEGARLFAIDKSDKALAIAHENARRHGVSDRIRFFEGDLLGPLDELDLRGKADVITANPPYIKSSELHTLQAEVRDFEPEMALIAGPEGTEIAQRIIDTAHQFLKKGGSLIMEMGMGQAETLRRMVKDTGKYSTIEILKDLAGIERVLVVKKT